MVDTNTAYMQKSSRQARKCAQMRTSSSKTRHAHTPTCTCKCVHSPARTHERMHTDRQTDTHTHTHTHTHTQLLMFFRLIIFQCPDVPDLAFSDLLSPSVCTWKENYTIALAVIGSQIPYLFSGLILEYSTHRIRYTVEPLCKNHL